MKIWLMRIGTFIIVVLVSVFAIGFGLKSGEHIESKWQNRAQAAQSPQPLPSVNAVQPQQDNCEQYFARAKEKLINSESVTAHQAYNTSNTFVTALASQSSAYSALYQNCLTRNMLYPGRK